MTNTTMIVLAWSVIFAMVIFAIASTQRKTEYLREREEISEILFNIQLHCEIARKTREAPYFQIIIPAVTKLTENYMLEEHEAQRLKDLITVIGMQTDRYIYETTSNAALRYVCREARLIAEREYGLNEPVRR